MATISDLIKIFESEQFNEAASEYYKRKERFLNDDCKDEEIFIPYFKAALIDKFVHLDDIRQASLLTELSYDILDPEFDINIFEIINTSVSKEKNKIISNKAEEYFDSLKEHLDDPVYKELSTRNMEIINNIVEFNGFTFMRDIKPGATFNIGRRSYTFDEDEIKTLNNAKMAAPILNKVHALYDESNGYDRPKCNYDAINNDILKKLAFHTDKNNPEFEIIFDDGTIINYYNGDIRIKPFDFKSLVCLTKLSFVDLYRNKDQNEIEDIICPFDNGIDPYNMSEEEFSDNLFAAFNHIYKCLYFSDEVYSEKMINDYKKEEKKLKELILKYNLNEE